MHGKDSFSAGSKFITYLIMNLLQSSLPNFAWAELGSNRRQEQWARLIRLALG